MSRVLAVRNRQRVRRVHFVLLRRLVRNLLTETFGVRDYELCLHLVGAREMAQINRQFLRHEGSTDVITFDHSAEPFQVSGFGFRVGRKQEESETRLHGEIFICVEEAVRQARRFRTTWQCELARDVIHGLLHLRGHDDLRPPARRKMKREENRLLKALGQRFDLAKLESRNSMRESR